MFCLTRKRERKREKLLDAGKESSWVAIIANYGHASSYPGQQNQKVITGCMQQASRKRVWEEGTLKRVWEKERRKGYGRRNVEKGMGEGT